MTNKTIYGANPFQSSIDNRYHYVYRITNLVEGKHYYGSRTSSKSPELDITTKYFGSPSSEKNRWIIDDQKVNPTHYRYKILRCFETRKESVDLEILLHKKFNVKNHLKFYNEQNQTTNGFDTAGKTMSRHQVTASNAKRIGKNRYTDPVTGVGKMFYPGEEPKDWIKGGRKWSNEAREKHSILISGRKFQEEHKKNLSKSHTGKKMPLYTVIKQNAKQRELVHYYNPITGERKRFKENTQPIGFIKGCISNAELESIRSTNSLI